MSHVPENPDAGLVAVKCAIEMKLGWQGWRRTLQWFAPKLIINASLSIEVREWDSCQEFPVRHTRNSSSSAAALSSSLEYELSCLQIDKFVDDGFNSSSHIVPSFRSVMFLIASRRRCRYPWPGLASFSSSDDNFKDGNRVLITRLLLLTTTTFTGSELDGEGAIIYSRKFLFQSAKYENKKSRGGPFYSDGILNKRKPSTWCMIYGHRRPHQRAQSIVWLLIEYLEWGKGSSVGGTRSRVHLILQIVFFSMLVRKFVKERRRSCSYTVSNHGGEEDKWAYLCWGRSGRKIEFIHDK